MSKNISNIKHIDIGIQKVHSFCVPKHMGRNIKRRHGSYFCCLPNILFDNICDTFSAELLPLLVKKHWM